MRQALRLDLMRCQKGLGNWAPERDACATQPVVDFPAGFAADFTWRSVQP